MWSIKTFSELTTTELYAIYELRVKTFVVEQQRIYQEVDDTDLKAYHVFKTVNQSIIAYARIFTEDDHLSFGRVVVDKNQRGQHLGADLMAHIEQVVQEHYADLPIQIEAQVPVQGFYQHFGFTSSGTPFLFNHTPHIKMTKPERQRQ
ncbi:GNAT family N-acetyltransferase [Lactiplantibacillus plantarum]|uniref:GNAT family N-acetyltransferase n=1 Tax=Lactiplantibacillus plantarum TaxID=1590 RepID=UPI000D58BAA8|nr:GNAT family N-acetyltransferase [Lactiplantibacillus plantarum]AWI39230.1 GNAT family N-acetyltransferase [Lactiplantibacillus plantarum]WLT33878.1 GNAT family N-acetyltransferase [Lactiplantibacillus plantarum]